MALKVALVSSHLLASTAEWAWWLCSCRAGWPGTGTCPARLVSQAC